MIGKDIFHNDDWYERHIPEFTITQPEEGESKYYSDEEGALYEIDNLRIYLKFWPTNKTTITIPEDVYGIRSQAF
jgi:hypothetical protein